MKSRIVLALVMLLMVGGCLESFALIGGGAAGGMTIARILDQQQKVIREDIAMLEQELAKATDEAEKERIKTVLADLKDADEALTRAKEGLNVNWQDPQSVIPFAGAALMTIFGIWQRREKRKNQIALTEVVAGGQEFKRVLEDAETGIVLKSFKEAHNDKQSPETKKLVAVIKA